MSKTVSLIPPCCRRDLAARRLSLPQSWNQQVQQDAGDVLIFTEKKLSLPEKEALEEEVLTLFTAHPEKAAFFGAQQSSDCWALKASVFRQGFAFNENMRTSWAKYELFQRMEKAGEEVEDLMERRPLPPKRLFTGALLDFYRGMDFWFIEASRHSLGSEIHEEWGVPANFWFRWGFECINVNPYRDRQPFVPLMAFGKALFSRRIVFDPQKLSKRQWPAKMQKSVWFISRYSPNSLHLSMRGHMEWPLWHASYPLRKTFYFLEYQWRQGLPKRFNRMKPTGAWNKSKSFSKNEPHL